MENTTNWLEKYSKNSIANAWMETGGSFLKNIGEALLHADIWNTAKIIDAFGQYIEEYEEDIKRFQKLEDLENKPMKMESNYDQKRKRHIKLKTPDGGNHFGFDIPKDRKDELANLTINALKSSDTSVDFIKTLADLELTDTEYLCCMFAVIKAMKNPLGEVLDKIFNS